MAYKTMLPALCKAVLRGNLDAELVALDGLLVSYRPLGFAHVSFRGGVARHPTGCLRPPEVAEFINSLLSELAGIRSHRAIGSFAKRTRQPHHISSTPSIKGLPHTPC